MAVKQCPLKIFRPKKLTTHAIELGHQRIFILPTNRGLNFALLIVLLLLIAFVYNNNLVYLLAFLLGSIFFITILHSFQSLSGLVIQIGAAQSVYAGEAVGFDFYLHNPSKYMRPSLQIKLRQDEANNNVLTAEKTIQLPAKTKICTRVYSMTNTRGWHACEPLILASNYPLGLFRAWSVSYFDLKALIYPTPSLEKLPFPVNSGDQEPLGKLPVAGTDDFYGLKEYQAGDAIRRIHWKAYAKGQGLYSKQYDNEAIGNELWLSYAATTASNSEQRLSQLCRWLIEADTTGLEYGFEIAELRLEPSSGSEHLRQCLHALAVF